MKDIVAGLELFAAKGKYGQYLSCDSCRKALDAPRINVGTAEERIGSDKQALIKLAVSNGWDITEDRHLCKGCK